MGQRPVGSVARTATDRPEEASRDARPSNVMRLVVLGSGITALAVARNAHDLGIAPVVVDIEAGIATASSLARARIVSGPEPGRLLDTLVVEAHGGAAHLIATTDAWLRFIAAHRADLTRAYARILHPSNDTLAICLSKARFSTWCAENRLPTPRAYPVDEDFRIGSAHPQFPLLLRPDQTLHSAPSSGLPKAAQARSREELDQQLNAYRRAGAIPVVSQSLLGRRLTQYSVGIGRISGRTVTIVAKKLRPPPEACTLGTLVETAEEPDVERLARQAADLLDYEGIGEVEVLRDEDSGENFLIEVNARPWMQMGIAQASGLDLLEFVLTGQAPREERKPARWLHFHADLYVCFARGSGLVRTGALPVRQYLGSIARANVFALWSVHDTRPFWRDLVQLVRSRLGRKALADDAVQP